MFKIGFACKFVHPTSKEDVIYKLKGERLPVAIRKQRKLVEERYNTKTTTITWLRNNPNDADNRLSEIVNHNLWALKNLITYVSTLPDNLKMVRISSDILPVFTHPEFKCWYTVPQRLQAISAKFKEIGDLVRYHNIRISFHPGQYVVLGSDKDSVIQNSIEEFEYHALMANWMGYGNSFQDGCKINVHIGGRGGPDAFRESYKSLSQTAQNCITVENDEFGWGIEDTLSLGDIMPIVLDIHHHFVRTGEHIQVTDDRVKDVIASWRSVRPTMHYSTCKENLCDNYSSDVLLCRNTLMESGLTKSKLRAHSDYYWNNAENDWALTFLSNFDIMCESKMKNLAAIKLYEYYLEKTK